jgi:hypothetical protein
MGGLLDGVTEENINYLRLTDEVLGTETASNGSLNQLKLFIMKMLLLVACMALFCSCAATKPDYCGAEKVKQHNRTGCYSFKLYKN